MNIGTTIIQASIVALLLLILKKVIMSQETLDALKSQVTQITGSLTNIKDDIQRIKDSLPVTGGLTEAEVTDLKGALDAAVAQASTLDQENEPTT